MRIHHVISSIDEKHGGPSITVPALCDALSELGHEVVLHSYAPVPNPERYRFETRGYHRSRIAPRAGLSWNMPGGLRRAAKRGDIMHVNGLWMLSNVLPAWMVRGTACKLVVAPRGMLEPWALAQSARQKALLWRLLQGPAVRRAALLHATATTERDSIRNVGLTAPVAIVPNGVDLPASTETATFDGEPRTLLFLGRLHPVKGLDVLLRAWAQVQHEFPSWQLRLVGPDSDDYLSQLRALGTALQIERVEFLPALYGPAKAAHFRAAQLFVQASHSENFGLAIAEALAYGLPVIAGRGTPWATLVRERAGYHVETTVDGLTACLRDALARPAEDLRAMGARGRAFVARDFSWAACARNMAASYAWLLGAGPRPDCIAAPD